MPIGKTGRRPVSLFCICFVSQKTSDSVLFQQQTSVLSRQQTCPLWQEQTYTLSEELNVEVSEVSTTPMKQWRSLRECIGPKIIKNDPKWVENGRWDLRIGPRQSHISKPPIPRQKIPQNRTQTPKQPLPAAASPVLNAKGRVAASCTRKWKL